MQDKDLLAIRVKDPASFGISKAIPLKPDFDRETELVMGAQEFSLVQFPYKKHNAAKPVEIAFGRRYNVSDNQPSSGKFSIVSEVILGN